MGAYNGSLGRRRYEGFDESHAHGVDRANARVKDQQRAQRENGVAPVRPPRTAIEGAHLRTQGVVTLDDIRREYLAALDDDEAALPAAS